VVQFFRQCQAAERILSSLNVKISPLLVCACLLREHRGCCGHPYKVSSGTKSVVAALNDEVTHLTGKKRVDVMKASKVDHKPSWVSRSFRLLCSFAVTMNPDKS
jgi:hypothetical protein